MIRISGLSLNDKYVRSVILVVLFFVATPVVIISSLISLMSLSQIKNNNLTKEAKGVQLTSKDGPNKSAQLLSALSESDIVNSVSVGYSDARADLIEKYLNYYKSPLASFSKYLVEVSDSYGLDYRLLAAIAQQESNLCKVIPDNSFNCWGWGIHSKGILKFSSYEEAIEVVARGLKEEYIDKGYINPEDIMSKYTPMSQGSWALGVSSFMEDMENGTN